MKSIDIFKTQNDNEVKKTILGAIISILAVIFISILIILEIVFYVNSELKHELLFENSSIDHIPADLDVEVYRLPCERVALDFYKSDSHHSKITKFRTSVISRPSGTNKSENQEKKEFTILGIHEDDRTVKDVQKAFKNKEGCRIKGLIKLNFKYNTFKIKYTPGNISEDSTDKKTPTKNLLNLDFKHKVHKLTFGPDIKSLLIKHDKQDDDLYSSYNALQDHQSSENEKQKGLGDFSKSKMHAYFLQ